MTPKSMSVRNTNFESRLSAITCCCCCNLCACLHTYSCVHVPVRMHWLVPGCVRVRVHARTFKCACANTVGRTRTSAFVQIVAHTWVRVSMPCMPWRTTSIMTQPNARRASLFPRHTAGQSGAARQPSPVPPPQPFLSCVCARPCVNRRACIRVCARVYVYVHARMHACAFARVKVPAAPPPAMISVNDDAFSFL